MNILVMGAGEKTSICYELSKSKNIKRLCAPGNAGGANISNIAMLIPKILSRSQIFAKKKNKIDR